MLRLACWLAVASVVLICREARAEEPAPGVMVHIDSQRPVELFKRVGPAKNPIFETTICAAPCDQVVEPEPGAEYFVDGDRVPRSAPFPLERPGPVRLAVDAGSSGHRLTGAILIGVGSAGATAGAISLLLKVFVPEIVNDGLRGERDDTLSVVGFSTIGMGVAMGVIGIVVMANSGTRVAVEPHKVAGSSPFAFRF